MKTIDSMRPAKMYDPVIRQREKDGKSFYRKYSTRFVDVDCPACGSKGKIAFKKYGFSHKRCPNCLTTYCSPRPTEELLSIYYNRFSAPKMWTELLLKTDIERKTLQYAPRVERIVSMIKKGNAGRRGTALDLGAGSGAFTLCLKKSEYFDKVIALDISQDCVDACKNIGLDSSLGTIKDVPRNSLDLICMNDLIEHVFDPLSLLIDCSKALRNNGHISIATPNGEGFDFKILKEKTKNITPPEHINYFNTDSIAVLLERAGFEAVDIETPGKLDVEMILKEKLSGFPLKEKNEYLDYLLGQPTELLTELQKFISANKLSSHMLALARKKETKQ